jgi:hypothetical protein
MDKLIELDRLMGEAEQKLMGNCEDGCESISPERWAEIGDGVRVTLQVLRQQIFFLYSSNKELEGAPSWRFLFQV